MCYVFKYGHCLCKNSILRLISESTQTIITVVLSEDGEKCFVYLLWQELFLMISQRIGHVFTLASVHVH